MREQKTWIARNAGCTSEMEGGLCVRSQAEITEAMRTLAGDIRLRDGFGRGDREEAEYKYCRNEYIRSYNGLIRGTLPHEMRIS